MDPDATLEMIASYLKGGDYAGAKEMAERLLAWLERGGFAPDWSEHYEASEFVSLFDVEDK